MIQNTPARYCVALVNFCNDLATQLEQEQKKREALKAKVDFIMENGNCDNVTYDNCGTTKLKQLYKDKLKQS